MVASQLAPKAHQDKSLGCAAQDHFKKPVSAEGATIFGSPRVMVG
jgi:hypothetical protein